MFYNTVADQAGATAVVNPAIKQLERVKFMEWETIAPLSLFAEALMPIDALRAAEIMDDVVVRVNRRAPDTPDGRTSVDSDLFRLFASKDEVRARSGAQF